MKESKKKSDPEFIKTLGEAGKAVVRQQLIAAFLNAHIRHILVMVNLWVMRASWVLIFLIFCYFSKEAIFIISQNGNYPTTCSQYYDLNGHVFNFSQFNPGGH